MAIPLNLRLENLSSDTAQDSGNSATYLRIVSMERERWSDSHRYRETGGHRYGTRIRGECFFHDQFDGFTYHFTQLFLPRRLAPRFG